MFFVSVAPNTGPPSRERDRHELPSRIFTSWNRQGKKERCNGGLDVHEGNPCGGPGEHEVARSLF